MSDIQKARDVLAKWREKASVGSWSVDHVAELRAQRDGRLIVGTAGNPELWEALDEGLRQYGKMPDRSIPTFINRIAAAIVAADERMSA